jgi:hypothetical protein
VPLYLDIIVVGRVPSFYFCNLPTFVAILIIERFTSGVNKPLTPYKALQESIITGETSAEEYEI